MKKLILICLLFFSVTSFSWATDPDTSYVQTFKNLFALKLFVVNPGFTYTITPRNTDGFTAQQLKDARVLYNPYIPPSVGAAINIKGIGLSYAMQLGTNFWDTTHYAKSEYKQFAMNIYKINFGFEGYYQDCRRFYYHFLGDNKLYRNYNSDIRAYQMGMNFILMPNGKRFSYNAAFNQNVIQKKSAGSFMFMFSLKFNEIKGDSLIPLSVRKYYEYQYTRNRNYAFLINPGYGFNLTKKDLYLSSAVLVGVGIQNQTYLMLTNNAYKISFPLCARGKLGIGYNGRVFYTGAFGNVDFMQTTVHQVKTQQIVYSYGVFAGIRFVKFTKTKGQIKQEDKRKRDAEKAAQKKKAEAEKAAKKKAKEDAKKKKK